MPLREDDVAPRAGVPDRRTLLRAGGFLLAIAATLAVFLTDDPRVLKLAVVGVAWAFVIATFTAASRSTERMAAAAREAELRRAYEYELDREVAARREYELELEAELRREAEASTRAELDAVHAGLAALTDLREQIARLADVRTDVTALASLRDEVARVAALRDDVAALTSLRQEFGQLAELRDDMGRLRQELTDQLSSEMLVERIVMRTQAGRLTSDVHDGSVRAVEAATRWAEEAPPRELTGGWPAVRLDEPRETRQFEQVRVERAPVRPPVPAIPPTPPPSRSVPSSWELSSASAHGDEDGDEHFPSSGPLPARADTAAPAGHGTAGHGTQDPPPTAAFPMAGPVSWPEPSPSPLEWLAARSLVDAEPTSFRPEVPPRRRRGDQSVAEPGTAATPQRPAVAVNPPIRAEPEQPEPPVQEKRLADILAENGVAPATGGRRRRRYRDEGEPDDVLARVLRDG